MARKSFVNQIQPMETSIAIERLLIAYAPQTWTPGRVDFGSIPTGFFDLGAVVEDTPSFKVTREIFQLKTGIPSVLQYQAVTGLEGTFEVSLHSNSWRKAQVAMGNYAYTSGYTVLTSISSVTNQYTVTLAGTTWLDSIVAGHQVVLATTGNYDNIDAMECKVSSVNTTTFTLVFDPQPPSTPTTSMGVAAYSSVRQYLGTSRLKNYVLLGVGDFIDGVQVVHYFPKVQPAGEFSEEIRPGQNQRIQLKFNAFGVVTGVNSFDELVIAERHYFRSTLLT
jgi:hypothetical protein